MPDLKPLGDERALLSAYLRDRSVPCPRCGYDLRALESERCPECGDALQLQIGLVEPRLAVYFTTLAAACIGIGGSTLFLLIALFHAPRFWWLEELAARGLLALLGISLVMLLLIVIGRRRFCRLSPRRQEALATAAWLVVGALSVFVVTVFE